MRLLLLIRSCEEVSLCLLMLLVWSCDDSSGVGMVVLEVVVVIGCWIQECVVLKCMNSGGICSCF